MPKSSSQPFLFVIYPGSQSHLFNFFGITDADYCPKPACSVVPNLILELGSQ
jgi:hypothetical protein